jgi:signal transduction histidine kinase
MTTPSRQAVPRRGAAFWGTLWRMLLALVVGALLLLFSYGEAFESVHPTGPGSVELGLRLLLDVLLGTVAIGLLPLRRRAPYPVLLLVIALSAFSALAVGAAALIVVSLSTRRRWVEMTLATGLFVAASLVFDLSLPAREPIELWLLLLLFMVVSSVLPLTGMYIGGRRQLFASLHRQADSAHREQRAEQEQARLSERARIAREMHDVLAHRLSLVALHAGVLESRPDLTSDQRASTAGIVRDNAHRALDELREVLGVLHDPAEAGSEQRTTPQPTLENVPELLRQSNLAGNPAVLSIDGAVEGRLDDLSEATARHLYRFIQEGLTNARKHAPGEAVEVSIGGKPGKRVTLRMDNTVTQSFRSGLAVSGTLAEPRSVTSGRGLAGLRERARLAGGELTAEAVGPRRFSVNAWLPWS